MTTEELDLDKLIERGNKAIAELGRQLTGAKSESSKTKIQNKICRRETALIRLRALADELRGEISAK